MFKFWQLEAWAKTAEIEVERPDDTSADDIRFSATENARDQRDQYRERQNLSFTENDDNWEPADEDRSIVAFLRHTATNYDELLAELEARLNDIEWFDPVNDHPTDDEVDAYTELRRMAYETIRSRVHAALAAVYPELADEFAVADYPT
jgi:hypothetical protein